MFGPEHDVTDRRDDLGNHDDAATDEPEAVETAGRHPAMQLFVRRMPGARRPLELLRLDSWGDTLLGSKLRGELATGYAILLAVCVFEVCAWTLLFNYIFQGAQFAVNGWTCAAIGLGLLWGIGIFTIDKNLITSDLLRPGLGKLAGAGARITLVLGSAYLTAQPIEQLVFGPKIEERLKEETAREEAVAYAERVRDVKAKREKVETTKLEDDPLAREPHEEVLRQRSEVERRESELQRDKVDMTTAESTKDRADAVLSTARWILNKAQKADPESQATVDAKKRLQWAWNAASQATSTLDHARSVVQGAEQTLRDARAREKDAQDKYDHVLSGLGVKQGQAVQQAQSDENKLRSLVYRLRRASYNDRVEFEDGSLLKWKQAGAMERAAILAQLRDGKPPRWPDKKDPKILAQAAEWFGLPDDFSSAPARGEAFGLWFLVLFVAAAIPMLSVFYKLTMSHELKLYYSVAEQAGAGNPDAMVLQRAESLRAAREGRPAHSLADLVRRLRWRTADRNQHRASTSDGGIAGTDAR